MSSLYDFLNVAVENLFLFGIVFVVTLGIVIVVHELGHYIAARFCGVHVEEFSFGFGKEVFGLQKDKAFSTRFSIRLFPLGGYVKLFGDVDPNRPVIWDKENNKEHYLTVEELDRAFCTKTVWQRLLIVIAGPLINVALTVLIFTGIFTFHGKDSLPTVITAIAQGSAAHKADIRIGDKILRMDGRTVESLDNDVYSITWRENPPQEHLYTIERGGETIEISYTANRVKYTGQKGIEAEHGQTGMVRMAGLLFKDMISIDNLHIGENAEKARDVILQKFDKSLIIEVQYKEHETTFFNILFPEEYNSHLLDPEHAHYDRAFAGNPKEELFIRFTVWESLQKSFIMMRDIVVNSYRLISVAHKGKTEKPVIGGVASISEDAGNAAKGGMYSYLMFVAGFSFVIAFINILPIPLLDGGYVMFLLYEAIAKKPLSMRVQEIAMIVGLVILVGIMVLGNVSDLISLLSSIQSD